MRLLLLCLAAGPLAFAACDGAQQDAARTAPATVAPGGTAEATLAGFGAAATPPAGIEAALRAHLAARLRVDAAAISLLSFEPVAWPDACLGVSAPGRVCAQVITPGWVAILRGPDGHDYRYHGTAGRFVPAP